MEASEALEAAAMHIRRYGHMKGAYGRAGEPCCISGAITVVSATNNAAFRAQVFLCSVLRYPAALWNDRPETTPGAAFNALWAAAKLARSEGQ